MIVRWPGMVTPDSQTDEVVWQGDIFSTLAQHLGVELAHDVAPDGESFLPILQGNSMPSNRRPAIVMSSLDNQHAIKSIDGWKLVDGTGGGGNSTRSLSQQHWHRDLPLRRACLGCLG